MSSLCHSRTRLAPGVMLLWTLMALMVFGTAQSFADRIAPRAKTKTLANGMRFIVVEQRELPTLSIQVVVRAGSSLDPPGKAGLAALVPEMLRSGAGKRSGAELDRYIDSLGIQFQTWVDRDAAHFRLDVGRRESLAAIQFLRDMLREPVLDKATFERLVRSQISGAIQAFDVGSAVALDLAYGAMFPGQALGEAPRGNSESLENISLADVTEFLEKHYTPRNITLIVAGDLEIKREINTLTETFFPIPRGKSHAPDAAEFSPVKTDSIRFQLLDAPRSGGASIMIFALASSPRDTSSFAADIMLAHLLGGYPEISYLGRRLVEEQRLITNLTSTLPTTGNRTFLRARFNCAAEQVVDVLTETLDITTLLGESRISKRELEDGKHFFRGSFAMAFESAGDISTLFAQATSAGLKHNYVDVLLKHIERLTQANIKAAAARLFSPGNMIIVVVGNNRQYIHQLAEFGSVSRVKGPREFE